MLAANQIARLLESKDFAQLVDRILTNGRCRSLLARQMLRQAGVVKVAAIGLGLQRIIELTYRPTPMADSLATMLLELQLESGLFNVVLDGDGCGDERRSAVAPFRPGAVAPVREQLGVLGASAVAIHGLIRWRRQSECARAANLAVASTAVERGLDAIAEVFDRHKETGQWADFAVDWAIVLWQLGDIEAFRARVPIDELLDMLDAGDANLLHDELCKHAQAVAA